MVNAYQLLINLWNLKLLIACNSINTGNWEVFLHPALLPELIEWHTHFINNFLQFFFAAASRQLLSPWWRKFIWISKELCAFLETLVALFIQLRYFFF